MAHVNSFGKALLKSKKEELYWGLLKVIAFAENSGNKSWKEAWPAEQCIYLACAMQYDISSTQNRLG